MQLRIVQSQIDRLEREIDRINEGLEPLRSFILPGGGGGSAGLLVFGCIHFYLIWFGDILISYALTGMVAFLFRNQSVRALLIWGGILILLQTLLMAGSAQQAQALAAAASAPDASAAAIAEWKSFASDFSPRPVGLRKAVQQDDGRSIIRPGEPDVQRDSGRQSDPAKLRHG